MKFCIKCGTQMEDDNMFCPECGASQQVAAPQSEQITYEGVTPEQQPAQTADVMGNVSDKAKEVAGAAKDVAKDVADGAVKTVGDVVSKFDKNGKVDKKFIPFIAGGLALIVVVILFFFFRSFVGSGSLTVKGAINDYYTAITEKDGKDFINASMSSKMRKAYMEIDNCDSVSELAEEMEDYLDLVDTKYRKIKIEDKDKLDRDDIEDFEDELEDESDVKVHISKMYEVEIEYEIKTTSWFSTSSSWEDESSTIYVYKAGGNWYVFPFVER